MPFRQAQGPERSRRAARQLQPAQERGHGGDFIALLGGAELAEDEAVVRRPGAHQMHGAATPAAAAAQGLAVQGDDFARQRAAQALGPGAEGFGELLRVEHGKDASEGVVAGDAVGQLQEFAQPMLLGLAELLHLHEALGPAQQRADGEQKDVVQGVALAALDAGVGEMGEVQAQTR